ncbi:2-hydroxyacid dehydrogenase [Mangrovihabitans endophyticus]|uniref:Dehydrogenase n=1 Tax=Mangrovihabitans endophyticus TaxID=1751298 RepID=A0A8J3FPW0_9ACTN|nr:2-hydroxyacid dehydrogenase [Mangrovihabitans endophyticus]GGK98791.1 dehydrogenase [Mangrovihabitans endophyticus]
MKVWIAHEEGRNLLGGLPDDVQLEVCTDAISLPSDPADVGFWVPPFVSRVSGTDLLPKMTALRAIQLLTAGADAWTGHVPADVTLCDARGVHDASTSEWVMTAVLAALRRFAFFVRAQDREQWSPRAVTPTPELTGGRVLLIGAGSIGRAIEDRMAPFEVTMTRVARTARPDEGVHGVDDLPSLLPDADVVVLVVPLTEQTRGMVDGGFLAALPDGALLVNASRGPVVDTAALLTELASGRISAALDVTDPEPLPPGHPLWHLPNVLITPHVGGNVQGLLRRGYALVGDQLRRFTAGDPLINKVANGY